MRENVLWLNVSYFFVANLGTLFNSHNLFVNCILILLSSFCFNILVLALQVLACCIAIYCILAVLIGIIMYRLYTIIYLFIYFMLF